MHSIVYGPPGTGKSSEVVRRIQALIDSGIAPERIGAVSFTKAAAAELVSRIVADRGLPRSNISTIHGLCYRLAGVVKDQVVDKIALKEFERIVSMRIASINPDEADTMSDGDHYLALLELSHALMHPSYEYTYAKSAHPGNLPAFVHFCKAYDKWKQVNGYVDFTDMLSLALGAECPKFEYLFIDEAQDLSPLQWAVIDHWATEIPHITVAGDDDQSIFVWGGADPHGMSKFGSRYGATTSVLDQSWRVPRTVQKLAMSLIARVPDRVDKHYKPKDEEGIVRHIVSPYQVKVKHGDDILFLYRNHALRKEIEQKLIGDGTPYRVDYGTPGMYDCWSARLVRAFYRVRDSVIKTGMPILTPGQETMFKRARWRNAAEDQWRKGNYGWFKNREWFEVFTMPQMYEMYLRSIRSDQFDVTPTVRLSSIHGSKGREADTVVLVNGTTQNVASNMARSVNIYYSEMRTFYVGVTRSKRRLLLLSSDNPLKELTDARIS